jgi:hypothetical protein
MKHGWSQKKNIAAWPSQNNALRLTFSNVPLKRAVVEEEALLLICGEDHASLALAAYAVRTHWMPSC